jgi:hypothetical protein
VDQHGERWSSSRQNCIEEVELVAKQVQLHSVFGLTARTISIANHYHHQISSFGCSNGLCDSCRITSVYHHIQCTGWETVAKGVRHRDDL